MASNPFKSFVIPRFKLPGFVSAVGSRLPQWPHAVVLVAGLNALVRMKRLPEDSVAALEDKTFMIEVLDTGARACFTLSGGVFRPLFSVPESPDLAFRANLSAFLQLAARQEDPDTLFFSRELSIEGDTELGLIVKNMLDAIEWPAFPLFPGAPAFRH